MHTVYSATSSLYSQLSPSFSCPLSMLARPTPNLYIWSPGCSKPCIFGSVRAKHTLGNAGDFSRTATQVAAASVQKEHPAAPAVDADEGSEDYAGGLCIVCFDAERSAILAPCGHVAMCRCVFASLAVLMHLNEFAQLHEFTCLAWYVNCATAPEAQF